MWQWLLNFFGFNRSSTLSVPRSSRWRSVRAAWLVKQPRCAICGCKTGLNVHHKVPVHVDRTLELEESNLITLGTACPTGNHHLLFGHLGDWHSWNPAIEFDADYWAEKLANKP